MCSDVLHYLPTRELDRGLPGLAELCGGVAFLETFTRRTRPAATRTASSAATRRSTAGVSRRSASATSARTAGSRRGSRTTPASSKPVSRDCGEGVEQPFGCWERQARRNRETGNRGQKPLPHKAGFRPEPPICRSDHIGPARIGYAAPQQPESLDAALPAPRMEPRLARTVFDLGRSQRAHAVLAAQLDVLGAGRQPRMAAGYEFLLHRIGKDYEKPEFGIHEVEVDGRKCPVVEREVLRTPFCRLLRFKRFSDDAGELRNMKDDPAVLVVAPLSGHHATLLRDTVQTLLGAHKVYITDWIDARMVPATDGAFTLDGYVATIERFIRHIGAKELHVISVCQPTVPVLAAVSLMAARGEDVPRSLVMMGGPIDTRESPTAVNSLAMQKPLWWFEQNLVHLVPANYPGRGRRVYPASCSTWASSA